MTDDYSIMIQGAMHYVKADFYDMTGIQEISLSAVFTGSEHLLSPSFCFVVSSKGAVAQWCNPLTLQPEQSVGVGLILDRTSPLEHHDKGPWNRLRPQSLALKTATSPSPSTLPNQSTQRSLLSLQGEVTYALHDASGLCHF